MPPNLRGGKSYRKGKKAPAITEEEKAGKFSAKEADQEYGRVLKMLGERRVLCFCNDGVDRVCKIRGKICKGRHRQQIEVGDIVLICFREFDEMDEDGPSVTLRAPVPSMDSVDTTPTASAVTHASGRKEIADLVEKVPQVHWNKMRKQDGIHRNLFLGGVGVGVGVGAGVGAGVGEDDIFAGARGAAKDSDSDSDSDVDVDAI